MTDQEMQVVQNTLQAKQQARDLVKAERLGRLAAARDKEDAFLRRLSYRNSVAQHS